MIINFANLGGGGGGGTTYTAGDYIQISGGTISATGVTSEEHSEEVEGIIAGAMEELNGRIPTIATTIDSGSTDAEAASAKAVYDALGSVGGSDYLPEIDTLPENPEDGAVYNYQGRLIKYVDGPGEWGEWMLPRNVASDNSSWYERGVGTLTYSELPASVDGQLLCATFYFGNVLYFFFDLTNNAINVYTDSAGTGTTSYVITKNGPAVDCNLSYNQFTVSWKDGLITFDKKHNSSAISGSSVISTTTSAAHYELIETPLNPNHSAQNKAYIVYFDQSGKVLGPCQAIETNNQYINGSMYGPMKASSSPNLPSIFAPTSSGATGTMLVSAGNTAPVWKTVAQALGVDFWTGTQDEYDALAPDYNATTLYIIVEEE